MQWLSYRFHFHRLITAYKRSFGKVMFSQASVCHFVQGDLMWPLPMMNWDMGTPWTPDMAHTRLLSLCPHPQSPPNYWHLVVITGDLFKLVHLRRCHPTTDIKWWPLNTYGWQAAGMHPTGVLFCWKNVIGNNYVEEMTWLTYLSALIHTQVCAKTKKKQIDIDLSLPLENRWVIFWNVLVKLLGTLLTEMFVIFTLRVL